MSSNRRANRWSLRRRLIAQLAGLLALVCLVVGVVTEFALREFLLGQLDNRLAAASERGNRPPPPNRPGFPGIDRPPPDALRAVGQGVGTLAAHIGPDGEVRAGVLRANTDPAQRDRIQFDHVPTDQLAVLVNLPRNGAPQSRNLGSLGEYRLVAHRGPAGDVLITGLPMGEVSETLWQLGFIFGGVALGALLVTGAVGALTIRKTLRPLDRLATTAAQVAELPLDRGEVALSVRVSDVDTDPRTEVGKLGAALNRMLGHVANALSARQNSESKVRQFVADASHELRTPLAAIRGYAELSRRHADELPPDVSFALSRVESESARMTTLVEDLLLLARLDSGRPVVHEPVDLSRLVADAVADAHAAGPDHEWPLDVPAEPITVLGDSGQLHQVVLNLLNNARTHTPPGTEVTTALSTSDGLVTLAVSDDGPGIPPVLLPEVFERFARGDTSRSRAAGSTGLGLAIVAAVVAAHRGDVRVDSRPGRTTFTVTFPDPATHLPYKP
ncbi:sensor histidine kinase [Amycolatopsis anabasis]|uniref:sensor histidine kinase n=1 Tax=Amycolatopsis anabasis TaxID=1840409 RepID=UPI00131D5801|nr:ATP-binding protein [Amycolatopsis anabasis]